MGTKEKLRWLTVSNLAAWVLLVTLIASGFTDRTATGVFDRIEAERLDIVGENGRPVLVLANEEHMPGPRINGKEYPREVAAPRPVVSGMIFYNEEGDEVGGLIYNGFPVDSGYAAVGHLSLDQWKQNQVVALQYLDNGRTRRSGLRVWDRSTEVPFDRALDRALAYREADEAERDSLERLTDEARARGDFGAERVFVGSEDRVAKVELHDTRGRVRARLVVDAQDQARLEFLDEAGAVVQRVPTDGR